MNVWHLLGALLLLLDEIMKTSSWNGRFYALWGKPRLRDVVKLQRPLSQLMGGKFQIHYTTLSCLDDTFYLRC